MRKQACHFIRTLQFEELPACNRWHSRLLQPCCFSIALLKTPHHENWCFGHHLCSQGGVSELDEVEQELSKGSKDSGVSGGLLGKLLPSF